MFNASKHEHKSSGIASGLEYRQEYRVGGRVGFHRGGSNIPQDGWEKHRELHDIMEFGGGTQEEIQRDIRFPEAVKTEEPITSATNLDLPDFPTLDIPTEPPTRTAGRTAEDIFLEKRELMDKYYTPIDYSQFNREPLDTFSAASRDWLKKRQEVIPAGTIGAPDAELQFWSSLGDARAETRTINEANELMELSVNNEQTLKMIDDATAQAETLRLEGRTDEADAILNDIEFKKLELGYADIDARLTAAGMSADATKYSADQALKKLPAEMQVLQSLLKLGTDPQLAFDTAFKQYNSKLNLIGILLESYQQQILAGMITPEEALAQAMAQAQQMFGSGFSLNQNDMTDLQDKAATMDTEGMSGYTTPNPKRTTEIPT